VTVVSELVEVADDYETFYEYAVENGWTDGLPVVPPTEQLVAAMLQTMNRDPGEVVANLAPLGGAASLHAIAVNAVMAGCRPEYLRVVVAAVDALADPVYQLVGAQVTTNSVSPVVVVSGPIRDEIGLNCGGGCFGPGWRSNATIGRAVSLILRNVGGARPPDQSRTTHANPARYTFCFGEDEAGSPWQPLHVERGLDPTSSAVTVVPIEGIVDCISGNLDHDEVFTLISSGISCWGSTGMIYSGGTFVGGMVVLSSGRAQLLADAGYSKADVKRRLWETAGRPAAEMPYLHRNRSPMPNIIDGLVYPTRRPEDLVLVVAGAKEPYHAMALPGFCESQDVTRPIPTD
jgi:hypothetical protein